MPDRPAAGKVLLRMHAASLNFRDLLMVRGHYNPRQPLPLVPCSDGVGEVVAVGDGVEDVTIGSRVTPTFAQAWPAGEPSKDVGRSTLGGPLDGALSGWMEVSPQGIVEVPEHLSHAEAACLPCAGVTAWSALAVHDTLRAGDTLLVLGTGGVSIFALQFANILGVRTIVTSSSDEKLARARELGAWQTINYKETPAWAKTVREMTDGRGVDHVLEVGGAGTLAQSLDAVRHGGQVSLIGVLSGVSSDTNILPVLMKQIRVQGIFVGSRADHAAMARAIAQHKLQPVVDRVFPLAESRQALEHMAGGGHFGKICIEHEG